MHFNADSTADHRGSPVVMMTAAWACNTFFAVQEWSVGAPQLRFNFPLIIDRLKVNRPGHILQCTGLRRPPAPASPPDPPPTHSYFHLLSFVWVSHKTRISFKMFQHTCTILWLNIRIFFSSGTGSLKYSLSKAYCENHMKTLRTLKVHFCYSN